MTDPIIQQMQEKARDLFIKRYDIHYIDGTTYDVHTDFENDLDTLIADTARAVIEARDREVRERIAELGNDPDTSSNDTRRGYNQALTDLLTHLTTK